MTERERNGQTTINVQQQANLIWNVADILRGTYKPHEYGKVILPMTVIKRLHDTLQPTLQKVLDEAEKTKNMNDVMRNKILTNASGYSFYNTNIYSFESLLADPANIEKNFRSYLNGFSENMQDILENFKFDGEISTLAEAGSLFLVIQEFNKKESYLGPDKVTSTDMGYIFEELVRKFSESYNEEAGAHFTSRDVIYLMTDLLLAGDQETIGGQDVVKTVYDQTMGTSQMLSAMIERIAEMNKSASVATFGQEINAETYAIAKADTMIRGGDPDNMALGSTLSNDKFEGYTFDYCISNPPFGIDWKKDQKDVQAEHERGDLGRFGVGLPRISDGQMLFLLNGISKLKETGRMAIVHNGSPLFTGGAGSGESAIRQHIIENDWLEAIVQLPSDLFYNTDITTYLWIITKNKSEERQGKIQLIDASEAFERRRKGIGHKRVDISEENRALILQAYGGFSDKEYQEDGMSVESKIFPNIFFGFKEITVESPLRLNFKISTERIEKLQSERAFINLASSRKKEPERQSEILEGKNMQINIIKALEENMDDALYKNQRIFEEKINNIFKEKDLSLRAPVLKAILSALSEKDGSADIVTNNKGVAQADSDLRDTERVPLTDDIENYFKREIIPYNHEAWIDKSKIKTGYEVLFIRHFFKFIPLEKTETLERELFEAEVALMKSLQELFEDGDFNE